MTTKSPRDRALVVFESMFGNTEQIAHAVANGLEREGLDVTRCEVSDAPDELPADIALLVVGAPTHAFSLSRPSTREDAVRQGAPQARSQVGLREWLTAVRLAPGTTPPVFAAFDTRVPKVRHLPMAAARSAAKLAEHRELVPIIRPVYFLVDDTRGPLVDGEVERALDWGAEVARSLRANATAQTATSG